MNVQHLASKTNDLENTYTFYTAVLRCDEARYDPGVGCVWLNFAGGFTLIFDRINETLHPSAVQYVGLEPENFAAVDRMYQQIAPRAAMGRDRRELCREKQGSYAFFTVDPDGCRIKVFKYNNWRATLRFVRPMGGFIL